MPVSRQAERAAAAAAGLCGDAVQESWQAAVDAGLSGVVASVAGQAADADLIVCLAEGGSGWLALGARSMHPMCETVKAGAPPLHLLILVSFAGPCWSHGLACLICAAETERKWWRWEEGG